MDATVIIVGVIALGIGLGIMFMVNKLSHQKRLTELEFKGKQIKEKAKKEANEIKYRARKDARKEAEEEKEEIEEVTKQRKKELKDLEKSFAKKETYIEKKESEVEFELKKLEGERDSIRRQEKMILEEQEKYKKRQMELAEELAKVSGLTREEAKNILLKEMEEDAKVDFAKKFRRLEEEANEDAEKNAKNIIGRAIQRFSGEYVAEKAITTVEIPNDDVKGRLIGREGRNIRAFEQICGVDLIIDDTPEIVVVSSFNVVRREIARLTLQKLIADGRIHPAKIEEFHDKSKSEMDKIMKDLGEKAQMEIGVHGIHPEILKLVGALNWRTSYTQNQYQHAIEAAMMCGTMASELGLNVKQARRAGLLHDIGKVIDASAEGSHAVVGADLAKRYGESSDIVHAIRAHHDDEKPSSVLAHIVAAADALSGARPGARKAMMESYVSRLTDIEEIVNSFEGVSKSYAISGGREVRVFVENDRVTDEETVMLSRDIAKKIEGEMSYPGTIKITVVRETKAVGVAK
tara:strand:- start:5071 stop:6630 length:1560 start_codon:yes stop_codon:yes gene_type:complete